MKSSILVVDDEPTICDILSELIEAEGYPIVKARSAQAAESLLKEQAFAAVFCDIHMPGRTGLDLYEALQSQDLDLPPFVFVSGNGEPQVVERAVKLGARDVVQKPFNLQEIRIALQKALSAHSDGLAEIMDAVQKISGVRLGPKKRSLVETRLMRRARFLKLSSVEAYVSYFNAHRDSEVEHLISAITTHTTEFFREPDHFDFFYEQILPRLIKTSSVIRIWSAACSSGEEAYSLAICYYEFLREKGIALETAPKLEIVGTDIDFRSVEAAQNGVYHENNLKGLKEQIRSRYFDQGTGDIANLCRLKDFIHRSCNFRQFNLLANTYDVGTFDVIFLRNVLIYFKSEDIARIAKNMEACLNAGGHLFVGHSESISNLGLNFSVVGNAIYSLGRLAPVASGLSSATSGGLAEAAPIKVLVVDDSASIRKLLVKILSREHGFEVIGEAENPVKAQQLLKTLRPDVITLDIHMPEMDGVTYLKSLSRTIHPPVVMISSVSYDDGVEVLKCFELGAVDYIPKPQANDLAFEADRIREVLRLASKRRDRKVFRNQQEDKRVSYLRHGSEQGLILIGASTGGIEAITEILRAFPDEFPPVVIVQHIPSGFSRAFAKRLNELCRFQVLEAQDGMQLMPDNVYIAPGGLQTKLLQRDSQLFLHVNDDPAVNRHKPSIDYMFNSVAAIGKLPPTVATILTGMGRDGADGLKKLRELGVHTIAQDEETSVVYGMPKVAADIGAAHEIKPLNGIAYHIFRALRANKAA